MVSPRFHGDCDTSQTLGFRNKDPVSQASGFFVARGQNGMKRNPVESEVIIRAEVQMAARLLREQEDLGSTPRCPTCIW
jgi:hypothetical protein